MLSVVSTERIPIKLWVDAIDDETLIQAKNLANLPFSFRHVALMPDAHAGYGMPIGGVLATKDVVVPNAVGVDIGCGMCAVQTSLSEIDMASLRAIRTDILRCIPMGFAHHKQKTALSNMPNDGGLLSDSYVSQLIDEARLQLGTLGGGNHFIEIQKGTDGYIWVMIHSGSRNLGKKVADFYNTEAKKLNAQWFSAIPTKHDLAFLPCSTPQAINYMKDMAYCVDFAYHNRKAMMDIILDIMSNYLEVKVEHIINIAHNYVAEERHFGEKVFVHRKGATSARMGETGIIPGSQGSNSYIVEGLGNIESYMSCSHGAGRRMGRNEAIRTLDLRKEIALLDAKGIVHGMKKTTDLEEATSAYKNIDEVMFNQRDLVRAVVELQALMVVKG